MDCQLSEVGYNMVRLLTYDLPQPRSGVIRNRDINFTVSEFEPRLDRSGLSCTVLAKVDLASRVGYLGRLRRSIPGDEERPSNGPCRSTCRACDFGYPNITLHERNRGRECAGEKRKEHEEVGKETGSVHVHDES